MINAQWARKGDRMQYRETGRLMRGLGGLYEILLDRGETPASGGVIQARAKGNFRHEGLLPLVGDRVRVFYDDSACASAAPESAAGNRDGGGAVIEEILPRKNALIRPPMANLDYLFITLAAANPAPVTETVDKLISIAEFNHIEPVLVIGKADLAPKEAEKLQKLYTCAGFSTFLLSAAQACGTEPLRAFLAEKCAGRVAAFAGASGVGKSTLLNTLFPELHLETGEISRKIARGRHTTRRVQLYRVGTDGFLADTPGFSMLDFVRFDFFTREDLPYTMRDFAPYIDKCRYTGCSHTKEEGCAVLAAVREGKIAASRHESFLAMYGALRNKHDWGKK